MIARLPPQFGDLSNVLAPFMPALKAANEAARQMYPVGHVQTWSDGSQSVMGPQGWISARDIASGAQPMPTPAGAAAAPPPQGGGVQQAGMLGGGKLPWVLIGGVGLVAVGLLVLRR